MVLVRRPFFHCDSVRCGWHALYGTVSERAAKTIRSSTLWQWKGYGLEIKENYHGLINRFMEIFVLKPFVIEKSNMFSGM